MDTAIEEKVGPILAQINKSTKEMFKLKGATQEQIKQASKEEDSPFFEGNSGIRNFFAQGLKPQVEKLYKKNRLDGIKEQLEKNWFKDGKYEKLDSFLQSFISLLALSKQSQPITIYREEAHFNNYKVGQKLNFKTPKSFSTRPQTIMGSTTFIVKDAKRGTCVSSLSPFPGEAEYISYNPKGYIVEDVKTKQWFGKPSHQIVTLKEIN